MSADTLLGALAALALVVLLVALPVALFLFHQRIGELERRLGSRAHDPGEPAAAAARTAPALPPALPAAAVATRPTPTPTDPDPLVTGLRRIGLLPPANLTGEGALGAWVAVRVGAALALAAVVFLGIWLNLRSTLPPWLRLAQVILLGVLATWSGARLSRVRPDLGMVVAALGLGILQFGAWAAHGLERMRVLESPAAGALAQLATASAIGIVAVRIASPRLAQLAAFFLALSGLITARTDAGAVAHGLNLVALAALGGLTLWRSGWTTVAWVSLAGATLLGLMLPADETAVAAGSSLATLLLLWLPTQSLTRRGGWSSGRARAALTFASVALPAVTLTSSVPWTDNMASSLASLASAALCALAGLRERRLGGTAGEMLLAASLGFAGAAGAWALETGLDWMPWVLAAAGAHLIARRSAGRLMEWTSDLLTAAATLKAAQGGANVGLADILLGVGALSLLLGMRGSRLQAAGPWRAALPAALLGVLLLSRFGGGDIAPELKGLAWLLPVLAALGTRSALPALAAAPVMLLTQIQAWHWITHGPVDRHAAAAAWSALLLLTQAGAAAWLAGRSSPGWSRVVSALAGLSLLPAALHLSSLAVPAFPEANLLGWVLAAAGCWAIFAGLRQLGASQGQGVVMLLTVGLTSLLPATQAALPSFGLAWSPVWVAGVLGFLAMVAFESRGIAWSGALAGISAAAFLLAGMASTAHLPGFPERSGYQSTVVWLVTAGLGFALGQLGGCRPLRLASLGFLALATGKLVAWDISDLVGRIIACAVAGAAFLGVAWGYARQRRD